MPYTQLLMSFEHSSTSSSTHKKRAFRETSHEAHESVKEHKQLMYDKIVKGLEKLKVGGTFEEIAKAANLKPEQVWKRLPEMDELGITFDTGIKRKLSSGRNGMVRQLCKLK